MIIPVHKKYFYKKVICFLTFFFLCCTATAQDLLQLKLTVEANRRPLKEVLNQMETKGKFFFSYNSDIISDKKIVTVHAQEQPVEQILENLLGTAYRYQVMDNHIIIRSAISQGIIVSGRLIEAETGQPIEFASVYEKSVLSGTMTDVNGNFKLHIRQPLNNYELVISKLSYEDTVIQVQKSFAPQQPIALRKSVYMLDSVDVVGIQNHWLARRLLSTKSKVNSINLNKFFARQPFQFSVLPGISSKNRLGSQTINKFSFNLLGGYSAGVRGFEYGTVFNIVQKDMQYVQLSGLFNMVGGSMNGVQVGGVYNYVRHDVDGVQTSAVFNSANGSVHGVQVSGVYNRSMQLHGVQTSAVFNWNKNDVNGAQITGIINKAHNTEGIQASGFMNWNEATMEGLQFAGALNKNKELNGVQFTGGVNYTQERTKGVQIAGIANVTRKVMDGVQIAGLLNYAKVVNGTQIGLLNIADTTTGLSIGLINIILKGKHSIDINTTEWQPYSIAYKSGSDRLYNIFQAGGNLRPDHKMLSIGYGIGNTLPLGCKHALVQEVSINTIYAGNWNEQNMLSRYQLMYQYQLHPKLRVYTGPAFSVLYYEHTNVYEGFATPYKTTYPSFAVGSHINCWLGWTLGVSIF